MTTKCTKIPAGIHLETNDKRQVKFFCTVLFFWWISATCFSQTTENTGQDIDFAFYLFEGRKYDELFLLFNKTSSIIQQNDSVNYILGMSYYYQKDLEKSAYHLNKISNLSAFYDKSIFFSALDYAHLGEYSKAQMILEKYTTTKLQNNYNELLSVQFAGLALLKRDFELFDHHAANFKFEQYYYINSENQLINVRHTLGNFKQKSPFVAGLLSTVVPGAGKIYTGQIGEGVASFLTVGGLAAITAENWVKKGLSNWRTITFGTICSIFYIGNIYGSAISVKVYRNQFHDKQNNTILLGIHLPVRALFE